MTGQRKTIVRSRTLNLVEQRRATVVKKPEVVRRHSGNHSGKVQFDDTGVADEHQGHQGPQVALARRQTEHLVSESVTLKRAFWNSARQLLVKQRAEYVEPDVLPPGVKSAKLYRSRIRMAQTFIAVHEAVKIVMRKSKMLEVLRDFWMSKEEKEKSDSSDSDEDDTDSSSSDSVVKDEEELLDTEFHSLESTCFPMLKNVMKDLDQSSGIDKSSMDDLHYSAQALQHRLHELLDKCSTSLSDNEQFATELQEACDSINSKIRALEHKLDKDLGDASIVPAAVNKMREALLRLKRCTEVPNPEEKWSSLMVFFSEEAAPEARKEVKPEAPDTPCTNDIDKASDDMSDFGVDMSQLGVDDVDTIKNPQKSEPSEEDPCWGRQVTWEAACWSRQVSFKEPAGADLGLRRKSQEIIARFRENLLMKKPTRNSVALDKLLETQRKSAELTSQADAAFMPMAQRKSSKLSTSTGRASRTSTREQALELHINGERRSSSEMGVRRPSFSAGALSLSERHHSRASSIEQQPHTEIIVNVLLPEESANRAPEDAVVTKHGSGIHVEMNIPEIPEMAPELDVSAPDSPKSEKPIVRSSRSRAYRPWTESSAPPRGPQILHADANGRKRMVGTMLEQLHTQCEVGFNKMSVEAVCLSRALHSHGEGSSGWRSRVASNAPHAQTSPRLPSLDSHARNGMHVLSDHPRGIAARHLARHGVLQHNFPSRPRT